MKSKREEQYTEIFMSLQSSSSTSRSVKLPLLIIKPADIPRTKCIIAMSAFILKVVAFLLWFFSPCASHMEGFIIGGETVKIDKFPHAVYLYVQVGKGAWICGASILNQRILLTAAHCLDGCIQQWTVKAFAGSEKVKKMKFVRNVQRYIIHRNYEPRRTTNDIALALLKGELPLGKTVKRVIVKRTFNKVKRAEVAGWGIVNDQTQEDAHTLKAVMQSVQPRSVCRKVGDLSSGMMCASNSAHARPSRGDSGSALVADDGQQIGLVSFRHPNLPELVVYTNISFYYDWITECSRLLICRSG